LIHTTHNAKYDTTNVFQPLQYKNLMLYFSLQSKFINSYESVKVSADEQNWTLRYSISSVVFSRNTTPINCWAVAAML